MLICSEIFIFQKKFLPNFCYDRHGLLTTSSGQCSAALAAPLSGKFNRIFSQGIFTYFKGNRRHFRYCSTVLCAYYLKISKCFAS